MKSRKKDRFFRILSREEGMIMSVELVLLLPVFALVVLGTLEFGHLWLVRHTLTIASREGARAAVVYYDGDNRESWAQTTAINTVNRYLGDPEGPVKWNTGDWTFSEGYPKVEPNPITGLLPGGTLTVRVESSNSLLVLHKAFTDITVVGETTMRLE